MRTMSCWIVLPSLLVAGAAVACFSACGIVGAPVAVGAAVASNSNLNLKGTVVDEAGNPLNEVLARVEHTWTHWAPIEGVAQKPNDKTVLINHTFDIGFARASDLTLTFNKDGYVGRQIRVEKDYIDQTTRFGSRWPKAGKARVVLFKKGSDLPRLQGANQTLVFDGEHVGFDAAGERITITIERQPLRTTGSDNRVDPLDINLPRRAVLRTSAPDGGFIRYTPHVGAGPFEQMASAPQSGYAKEIVLDAIRLREMRKAGADEVVTGHEYYFVRANGKYGKLAISWPNGAQTQAKLAVALEMQPDGSRNLASMEHRGR